MLAPRPNADVVGHGDDAPRGGNRLVAVIGLLVAAQLAAAGAVVAERRLPAVAPLAQPSASARPPTGPDSVEVLPPPERIEPITAAQRVRRVRDVLRLATFLADIYCEDPKNLTFTIVSARSDLRVALVEARDAEPRRGPSAFAVEIAQVPDGVKYTMLRQRGDCRLT